MRTIDDIKTIVQATPLEERLLACCDRIGRMARETKGPRMSIPVEPGDDDIFITTTLEDAREELAKRDELIKRYKPRPVSVQPTKTDADHHGRVLLIGPGGVSTQALHTDWRVHSSWTYWLPCSVDAYGLAPSPEEIERREFEASWLQKWPVFGGGPFERIGSGQYYHHNVEEAWQMWQAARAGKEGK